MASQNSRSRKVTVHDKPCGTGKTTKMIEGLNPDLKYLIITPLLSECRRIIDDAEIEIHQPDETKCRYADNPSKHQHLRELLIDKKNVVTTHALFVELVAVVRNGLLDDYHIIIDEVLNVAEAMKTVSRDTWVDHYIGSGFVRVDATGKAHAVNGWEKKYQGYSSSIDKSLMDQIASGLVYHVGKTAVENGMLVKTIPEELLKAGLSLSVYTYLSEGACMMAFLRKLGIEYEVVQLSNEEHEAWKKEVRELLSLKRMPRLENHKFSHNQQIKDTGTDSYRPNAKNGNKEFLVANVSKQIAKIKDNHLKGKPKGDIAFCCPKELFFKDPKSEKGLGAYLKGSKLSPYGKDKSSAVFIPKFTRGTNDYMSCDTMFYLYDQFLNPAVRNFFGKECPTEEEFALTEMVQVVWRLAIRDDKHATVYVPSVRMLGLALRYLYGDEVPREVVAKLNEGLHRKNMLCQGDLAA